MGAHTPHPLLGLAVLLFVLICGPALIEARCGYPELPYKSQLLPAAHYDNWAYFEEGQLVKVICENGLVGQAPNQTAPTTVSDQATNFMQVDSTAWIECRNARWNTSRLQCLQKVELDSRNVQVKFKRAEAWRNLEPLVDHDALSCLELDLDKAQAAESTEESVVLSLRLETPRARIPRVVLMLKNSDNGQRPAGHPNITLLEDMIEASNSAAANGAATAEPEGDLEAEEAKRFLDFVYQNEFVNHSGPVRMSLMEDDASDHKHKVIRTDRHEVRVSVALDSGHECYFNEDATISTKDHSTTELLIFDCHLIETDQSADAAAASSASSSLVWVRLDIRKLNDRVATANESRVENAETPTPSSLQLCGLEAFRVADGGCGRPYVPVYGVMTKIANSTVAQYSCQAGYRAINLTTEHEDQWANAQAGSLAGRLGLAAPMRRQCDLTNGRWAPSAEDIFCVPLASCRHPPPLPDPKKFYIEYSKLDNLKRAIAGVSTAALRCQQLTDYVLPYTAYGCDQSGAWVRLGKGNQTEPVCRPSLTRTPPRGRAGRGHYYHHYYHYYDQPAPTNRTSIIIFGRQINDNKNLIYFGAAGLVVLFGGSFIILFHVRRMAKKISRQMRERSYMAAEKGISESFLPVAGGGVGDGQLPPYYNQEGNFYDVNTMFSNDLPPPTTPISMPSSHGMEKGPKDRNNLSAGFDSIKF